MASSHSTETKSSTLPRLTEHVLLHVERMRNDKSSHDVVFIVGSERFSAHRCLMAAASPILRKMIRNAKKESNQLEIPLQEVQVDVWRVVLDYVYTGKMDLINFENSLRYLECAKQFRMKELEKAMSSYIKQKLNTSYSCEALGPVDQNDSVALRKMAMNTFERTFHDLYRKTEFTELSYGLVFEILGSQELIVRSELDVFLAAVHWTLCSGVTGIGSALNAEIAKRANELLTENDLEIDGLEGVKPGTGDAGNYSQLFECVDLNNLSDADLSRVIRFCRELWKEIQATRNVDLVHLREFSEKAIENLSASHNPIPNIPVPSSNRALHGRYDTLFAFSLNYYDVRNTNNRLVPVILDKPQNLKWYLLIDFRQEDIRGEDYLFCFLNCITTTPWQDQETRKFSGLMYVEVVKDDGQSAADVFWQTNDKDPIRSTDNCARWDFKELVPRSALKEKDTITIGGHLYFKII